VLTFSRSAWLGFFTFILIIFLKYGHFNKKWLMQIGIIGIFSFLLVAFSMRGLIFTRLGRTANAQTETYSTVTRLALIDFTVNMIRAHPLLGVGIGNFVIEMERTTQPAQTIEPMHSLPLLVFSELGVGAIIILIGLSSVIFASLQRAHQPLNIIFGAALTGVLVASLFDHYFWTLAPGRLLLGTMFGLWSGTVNSHAT
jgi:O-antigen ligase